MKKFNRPLPDFEDGSKNDGAMRAIRLQREGSGLEGLYAEFSSREEMQLAGYEQRSQRAWTDGVRYWMVVLTIWVVVTGIVLQFLTR